MPHKIFQVKSCLLRNEDEQVVVMGEEDGAVTGQLVAEEEENVHQGVAVDEGVELGALEGAAVS